MRSSKERFNWISYCFSVAYKIILRWCARRDRKPIEFFVAYDQYFSHFSPAFYAGFGAFFNTGRLRPCSSIAT
jgi:hypothetical protein